jgi:TraM recognition site of TraD and TraG
MIDQDINNGEGVCFIDPHGSDVQDILSRIPQHRYKDVIYFDPSHLDRPIGLNFLEYDRRFPEQKTFVINELMSIFKKLYGATPESMGPAFEQYFRNSAGLVMEDPESGNTLIDISRVLSDRNYRQYKLSRCKNPLIAQFWTNAEKTTGDQGLANYVQYISNKFDVFLSNDYMRPIIAQENSTLNFRQMMDEKKIFLVNLAKGRLGDINSNLIGLILIGKFTMAALSRVDTFGKGELPPFYLYIDEFHNFTTDSISTILAEARKYKLSLHMAHQYISQLDEGIKNAVFGNVGNMAFFRVGVEDAEFLEKQTAPVFTAKDIMNIENLNCYMKILSNGKPTAPFNVEEEFPVAGNRDVIEKLKELSYLTYGRDRNEVEKEVMKKYQATGTV